MQNENIDAIRGEDEYMDAVQELGDVAMDGEIIQMNNMSNRLSIMWMNTLSSQITKQECQK